MASYQAKIDLIVTGLKEIENAEKRIKNLVRESKRLVRGGAAQRGTVALASITREERQNQRRSVQIQERKITLQSKLNAATDLYTRKLEQFNRAGGNTNKQFKERVFQITQAFAVGTKGGQKNLKLLRALGTELGRLVEKQNELNRLQGLKSKGFEAGRRGFERISAIEAAGFADPRSLTRARQLVRGIGAAAQTGDQRLYNEAVRKAGAVLSRLEREYKEAERAQKAATKAKREVERAEKRVAAAATKEAKERKRQADKRKAARSRKVQDIAAGVGFPLLFGSGPGSVLGGALGAAFGGFGGSILGSAIGQQLDALGAAALSTAKAFDSLGDTASDLVKVLGAGRRGGVGATAEFLISEGLSSSVADILRRRFDEQFGTGTADTFQQISDTGKDLDDSLQAIGISLQKLMSGPLRGIANILGGLTPPAEVTPREANIREQRSLKQQINFFDQLEKRLRPAGGNAKVLTDFQEKRRKDLKAQLEALQAQEESLSNLTDSEKELNELLSQRINKTKELQALQTDLVRTQLTARRDDRAFAENNLVIATLESDLANTRVELKKEELNNNKTSLRARELENKEIKQSAALERARLKQANDVVLAKRQITKEELQNQIATAAAFTQSVAAQRQLEDLNRSEAESYKTVNDFIQGNLQTREEVLGIQKQIELSGKIEQEVIDAIVFKYAALVELERDRAKLKEEQARQAEILRQIEELRFRQSLTQATSDTRRSAEEQIRGTDPFRAFGFAGAGLGFFADSEQFQADRIASFNAQLERYNELIAAQQQIVAKGAAEGLDPDKQLGNKRELQRLQRARDDFELYQSQVDKAATSQARFNDALAAVSPGVNALVGGLQDIVAGTKTAQEVFADFLKTIADQLIQTAATMIAQYIAIGIAKAFAFGGGGGGLNTDKLANVSQYSGITAGTRVPFAEGGYVTGPTNALIGEGGEPEYVIPRSKMRESMARYSRGARGSSVIPSQAGGGDSEMSGGTAVAAPIDVRYTVERINSVDYVTADQFQLGMQRAAQQGAAEGERRTLRSLKNSPGTRRGVGM